MAGLQEYNFFPTDLFYPRPQPQGYPATLETASGKAPVLPLQTPIGADQDQQQQQQSKGAVKARPSRTALVYKQRRQSLDRISKKQSKFSVNPLPLLTWDEEEEGSDSF